MKNLIQYCVEANESASEKVKSINDKKTHLVVIRLSAMGDVAMTVPVLGNLLVQRPDLKITVVTRKFFAPLFSSLKQVEILAPDLEGEHKGIAGLWKLYKTILQKRPDAIADLHHVLRSNILRLFFLFNSIPFHQIDKGRSEKKALTALNKKQFKPLKSTHERYADVFRSLGYSLELTEAGVQPKRSLDTTLTALTGEHDRPWIGIAPFAAYSGKMYPLDNMKRVVENLNNTNKYKIFLFGGGKEELKLLKELAQPYSNAQVILGQSTFEQELLLISQLDIMLAMDSANGHLAAVFGVPTITLWGVTHPYAGFSPFNQDTGHSITADRNQYPAIPTSVYGNKYPSGYDNVMSGIAPEVVVRKIEEVLPSA